MIRRDYLLRMIEEFFEFLSRLNALKREQLWHDVAASLEDRFQQMFGTSSGQAVRLTETELLAKVIQAGPSQAVHEKALMLTTLLKESGDVAAAQARPAQSQSFYLKGLHLLLMVLAQDQPGEFPDFVPKVQVFLSALEGTSLPLHTLALLMAYYESLGQFARAEDILFSMLEADPANGRLLEFGISFYERIALHSNDRLAAGNLPRTELAAGLAELRTKLSNLQ